MKQPVALAYGVAGTVVAAAVIVVTASTSGLVTRNVSSSDSAPPAATVSTAASAIPVIPLDGATAAITTPGTTPAPATTPLQAAGSLVQAVPPSSSVQTAVANDTATQQYAPAPAPARTYREHEDEGGDD